MAEKKTRNWLAVHAHFRKSWRENSRKKKESKNECRRWKRTKGDSAD